MRIGSLFSGAGGLDLAVESVFGADVAWHCEIDPAASKVLEKRWPGIPNLGDVSAINWHNWKPVLEVDILCGGFPCQDVSLAGKRAGIKAGSRSGLWSVFADAIDALRPPIVVIENVKGLLSARAHRNLEPANPIVGDGSNGPVLRAAGAVLGDLADLGYDAQWATVAAADVGAPHRRERVFIIATNTKSARRSVWNTANVGAPYREINALANDCGPAAVSGDEPGVALLPTPNADVGRGVRSPKGIAKRVAKGDKQFSLEDAVALLPTPQASDSQRDDCDSERRRHTPSLVAIDHYLPTPNASDCSGGGMHPDSRYNANGLRHSRQLIDEVKLEPERWGKYEPAIRRWEAIVGPAPAPTEPNKNGNPRLSAAFSEWLMGWPDGWVTDPNIGISRNDQLRIIGNGVCPQQAIHTLTWLIHIAKAAA